DSSVVFRSCLLLLLKLLFSFFGLRGPVCSNGFHLGRQVLGANCPVPPGNEPDLSRAPPGPTSLSCLVGPEPAGDGGGGDGGRPFTRTCHGSRLLDVQIEHAPGGALRKTASTPL